jgi:hypothetical protein
LVGSWTAFQYLRGVNLESPITVSYLAVNVSLAFSEDAEEAAGEVLVVVGTKF